MPIVHVGSEVCAGVTPMRDPRVTRINVIYANQLLLVISALLWAFFLTAVPLEARGEQILAPLGTTVFALVMVLLFYPLGRIGWRDSVQPPMRAFMDGNRVEGTIESVVTTNRMITRQGRGLTDPRDAGQLMKQFVYHYTENDDPIPAEPDRRARRRRFDTGLRLGGRSGTRRGRRLSHPGAMICDLLVAVGAEERI